MWKKNWNLELVKESCNPSVEVGSTKSTGAKGRRGGFPNLPGVASTVKETARETVTTTCV